MSTVDNIFILLVLALIVTMFVYFFYVGSDRRFRNIRKKYQPRSDRVVCVHCGTPTRRMDAIEYSHGKFVCEMCEAVGE